MFNQIFFFMIILSVFSKESNAKKDFEKEEKKNIIIMGVLMSVFFIFFFCFWIFYMCQKNRRFKKIKATMKCNKGHDIKITGNQNLLCQTTLDNLDIKSFECFTCLDNKFDKSYYKCSANCPFEICKSCFEKLTKNLKKEIYVKDHIGTLDSNATELNDLNVTNKLTQNEIVEKIEKQEKSVSSS